ncbi:MAG: hypothetical protein GYA15_11960 [Leptolinea sp.]|jgi:hypothetical protein|nr:hypothetical protein [Leptolinea sp.]
MAGNAIPEVSFSFESDTGTLQAHFRNGGHHGYAVLLPLTLDTPTGRIQGHWEKFDQVDSSGTIRAIGKIDHPAIKLHFTLQAGPSSPQDDTLLQLDWRIEMETPGEGAFCHEVYLPDVNAEVAALTLPGIFYGHNTYGQGSFPHLDPARGFSVRADRLPQPAVHYEKPDAAWDYFSADETPTPSASERVYSVGMNAFEGGLNLLFRYPQMEYGHQGDGGTLAYVGKNQFAEGEKEYLNFSNGERLQKTLFLGCHLLPVQSSTSAPARFLWQRAYPDQAGAQSADLWQAAGEHLRWINERLYQPQLNGGQFESPQGSRTAMLGFVEQSLSMASVTLRYALACRGLPGQTIPNDTLRSWEQRGADVLNRWTRDGLSPEGLLYPACDEQGYFFGVRNYADAEHLTITRDETFETQRLTGEARRLLAAAEAVRAAGTEPENADTDEWVRAAVSIGRWLAAHPLADGGFAARYARCGEPVGADPSGTAFAVSLFCDLVRLSAHPLSETSSWQDAAAHAYHSSLSDLIRRDLFSGGTLDASCPDREAAIAALDACIQLYEVTRAAPYLEDARHAVDNLLTYTMVYPIRTFGRDTDAVRRAISTFGGSLVSPENQHLDPFPLGIGLYKFGLYAGDAVARQAALASLRFCLDGRWAMVEKEGLKQSEQFAHTRWFYNDFFKLRGNFRHGMPIFGLPDSEHGWCQVLPAAVLLDFVEFDPSCLLTN